MRKQKLIKWLLAGILTCCVISSTPCAALTGEQAILGKWKAVEKVLTIDIYRSGTTYKARIISFADHHNAAPADLRRDDKNPNPALRTRKIIGLDVLYSLRYDSDSKAWTGGTIYDAGSGREYSATVKLLPDGKLSVRAYKGISLLGKTLTFQR